MADMVKLVLEARNEKGKEAVKKLRPTGYIPAVFYGPEYKESVPVKVKALDIAAIVRSGHWETVRFNVTLPDGKEEMCLMRDVQKNFLNDDILHVDFFQLMRGRKVSINVPIVLEGREVCVGLKSGGVVEQLLYEVEIDVLPQEIPDSIVINVKDLDLNEGVYLKELPLTESAELLVDPEDMVVTVGLPKIEEEPEVEEEVAPGEVEVVAKGKAKEAEEEEE